MAQTPNLKATISAAQSEVDSWENRARLSGQAKTVAPRWPVIALLWGVLFLAIYAERHHIQAWLAPHDSSETVEQLSDILRHTAEDIETFRRQYGALPDGLPIDFLNGVIHYAPDGERYTLETTYHDSLLRLQADGSGPGAVEVLRR